MKEQQHVTGQEVRRSMTPDSETILKHMSYSAAKLWNVGNYEKRNYRLLGLEKFPDW